VNTVPTRVLIADDSEVIRGLLRTFLEKKWNVEVCAEAGDGQQTVDAAMALSPDLLILDVVMPKLNGIQVASVVKKNLPNTKTIVFTMYGDYVKNVALAAGVSVIVSKPDGICTLLDAVEALIRPSQSRADAWAP
jgi:DNA-binding NarL/FixJ family response regulator